MHQNLPQNSLSFCSSDRLSIFSYSQNGHSNLLLVCFPYWSQFWTGLNIWATGFRKYLHDSESHKRKYEKISGVLRDCYSSFYILYMSIDRSAPIFNGILLIDQNMFMINFIFPSVSVNLVLNESILLNLSWAIVLYISLRWKHSYAKIVQDDVKINIQLIPLMSVKPPHSR